MKTWNAHGYSRHPLYQKWQDMVRRCHSPKAQNYPHYGGVGVTVCEEWRANPVAFIEWALDAAWEPGMEIDKDLKISGNKLYSPLTCSIVSHRENMLGVVGRASGRKTSKLKLSQQDVINIVARKRAGEATATLARDFGVDIRTINRAYKPFR